MRACETGTMEPNAESGKGLLMGWGWVGRIGDVPRLSWAVGSHYKVEEIWNPGV
jgi:hypothetical protein